MMLERYQLQEAVAGKQRVLQLCHSHYAPFQDVARQYVSLFPPERYAVTTVYLTGEADASVVEITGGAEVIFLQYQSRQIRGLKRPAIAAVRGICEERGIAFAIAHRYKAIYIASHVPGLFVVGIHHAFGDYRRFSRRFYVNRHRARIALLGVSNAVRDDVRGDLSGWPEPRIQTLYNRVDYGAMKQALLPRDRAREALGVEAGEFVFANVGRLHPDKDQRTLIDAFARVAAELPDARLLIVGKGKLHDALQAQIDHLQLGEQVRLTGPLPEVAPLYSGFDAFLLSSDHEPFGMVLLEAMAAGLPIAASDCGGASEVVGGSGLLFPLGDSVALAAAMRLIYRADEGQRMAWQAAMDARVEALFTLEAGARAFCSLDFVQQNLEGSGNDGQ